MEHELTPKERERYGCVRSCIDGNLTNKEAAARLGLTIRQIQRLKRAVEKDAEEGIIHRGRGKRSGRKTKEAVIIKVVRFLKQEKHRDFGPTFAQEQLGKQKIALSVETVRTIMMDEKLWTPHLRRTPEIHRQWRERKAMYGELVQFDGSYHHWLENADEQCLLAAIDDATGKVAAVFDDNEGVQAVFRFWMRYIEAHGLPAALYMDKFSTYKINHPSAVDNADLMTQFERAMDELGIEIVHANSPEAKGRVERLFGTLQDRLVKELRLANIKNIEDANRFLSEDYLPEHNKRFEVPARAPGDAHRPLSEELRERLPLIFSIQSRRQVGNDFTIRFKSRWFQLGALQETKVYKNDTVTIKERLDGTIHICLKDIYLAFTELPERPLRVRRKAAATTDSKPQWKPAASHPWRKK
jgi:transposase-like protein